MGLPPMTPEEVETYLKHIEEIDRGIERRVADLLALGVKPIPKEQYKKYFIKDGMRKCPTCKEIVHNHPLGCIQIGQEWYDWFDVFDAVMGMVSKSRLYERKPPEFLSYKSGDSRRCDLCEKTGDYFIMASADKYTSRSLQLCGEHMQMWWDIHGCKPESGTT